MIADVPSNSPDGMSSAKASAEADRQAAEAMLAIAKNPPAASAQRRSPKSGSGRNRKPLWHGADINGVISWIKENAWGYYTHSGSPTGFYLARPEHSDDEIAAAAGLPPLRDENNRPVGYARDASPAANNRFRAVVTEAFDRMVRRGTVEDAYPVGERVHYRVKAAHLVSYYYRRWHIADEAVKREEQERRRENEYLFRPW